MQMRIIYASNLHKRAEPSAQQIETGGEFTLPFSLSSQIIAIMSFYGVAQIFKAPCIFNERLASMLKLNPVFNVLRSAPGLNALLRRAGLIEIPR
jgi:hypothetical protein